MTENVTWQVAAFRPSGNDFLWTAVVTAGSYPFSSQILPFVNGLRSKVFKINKVVGTGIYPKECVDSLTFQFASVCVNISKNENSRSYV